MQILTASFTRGATLLLVAVLIMSGCAGGAVARRGSAPPAQEPGFRATLQVMTDDYLEALHQAQATQEALTEIGYAPLPDLPQAFEAYRATQHWMEILGARLIRHADGMFLLGPAYLVEPSRTPESCDLPLARRSETLASAAPSEELESVAQTGEEIRRAYRAFQFDTESIRQGLSGTLTPASVESLDQIFEKAQVDATSLQEALERGLGALELAERAQAKRAAPVSPAPAPAPLSQLQR